MKDKLPPCSAKAPLSAALAALIAVAASTSTWAQALPPPSRTVFKCEAGGKVIYSDSPCLGAKKMEIEATRGVSKLSGSDRVGNDVRHERHRELIAEALKPLTGMDARQMDTYGRRLKLDPESRTECRELDDKLPRLEERERLSTGQQLAAVQRGLFTLRLRYRELDC